LTHTEPLLSNPIFDGDIQIGALRRFGFERDGLEGRDMASFDVELPGGMTQTVTMPVPEAELMALIAACTRQWRNRTAGTPDA